MYTFTFVNFNLVFHMSTNKTNYVSTIHRKLLSKLLNIHTVI